MSLLHETGHTRFCIMSADGLSVPNPETGDGIDSDDVQKIFPLSGVPVAIAHHGINIIDGVEIPRVIADFEKSLGTDMQKLKVRTIAEKLRDYVDVNAKKTLENPNNKGLIGFWIAGFSPGSPKPEFYEITWPDQPNPRQDSGVIRGGDGKKFVKLSLAAPFVSSLGKFDINRLHEFNEAEANRFHDALYRVSEARQEKAGERIFGGHQHRLLITKDGWRWVKRPKGA